MTFFKTIALSLSMFSSIPMPRVEWNEKNMKYILCAFPLAGAVTAALYLAWIFVAKRFSVSSFAGALGCTIIPVLVSGGIHLDGFCDACDALASHADKEKKLEIMKDSHSGAFAVIGCCVYFLSYYVLSLSVFSAKKFCMGMALIFVLERFLSALAVSVFSCAKESGLVRTFADASAKKITAVFSLCGAVAVSVGLVICCGIESLFVLVAVCAFFIYYYCMTKKEFGGITGDLAGWFVQVCELISLAAFAIVGRIA
jgi:adenosylcobinamide-GDP ribazoletransferase